MFRKMDVFIAITFLLIIELHSRNGVCEDTTDYTSEKTTPNTSKDVSATTSTLNGISISSSNSNKNATAQNESLPFSSIPMTTALINDDSNEITVRNEGKNKSSENYKQRKSIVAEIILQNLHTSGNSFVLGNLLNLSSNKYKVQSFGEPFNFKEFILNLEFENQKIGLGHNKSVTDFTNIHASSIPSLDIVTTFYNNFTCTSRQIEVQLNMIPENMCFRSDYRVNGTNKTSSGSVIFKQTGARLLYKIANGSEIYKKDNFNLLKEHGDIIYANGQVELTESCDNQCNLLTTSAQMFKNCKSNIFKEMDHSEIWTRIENFISTFPFLSICSSSSSASGNYYVITNTVIQKYQSSNLQLGPMILKGLDNFVNGKVIAMKSRVPDTPNSFILSTQANHIQGQCDWSYFKGNSSDSSASNYSFTFVIEEVDFLAEVNFSNSWNVNKLQINLGKISIHRYDKNCPKILDFTKCILENFVRESVSQSLRDLFGERFPELNVPTSTKAPEISTKKTEPKQIVYWSSPLPGNDTEVITRRRDRLPFPTRKVFTPCKDTRKWWQKLFYRNKCANKDKDED